MSSGPIAKNTTSDIKNLSIAIATPSLRESFTGYYVQCTHEFHKQCASVGINIEILLEGRNSLIAHARNSLVERFLNETNCSHILFVDDDIGFHAPHLVDMLKWSTLPVLGAIYPRRDVNWHNVKLVLQQNPNIEANDIAMCAASYERNVDWINGTPHISQISAAVPFEVSQVAAGLMLISRECLMETAKKCDIRKYNMNNYSDVDSSGKEYYEFFRSGVDENGHFVGEDVYFCRLIKSIGLPIHAYGAIHVVHSGTADHFGHPQVKMKYNIGI